MRKYLRLLTKKFYIGILIIVSCACLGSFRGAFKEEENFWVGVTQEDVATMDQAGTTQPDLTGVMPLAAEQLHWKNFGWAESYAFRGLVIYCILMLFYLPLYQSAIFKALRRLLRSDESSGGKPERLFIDAEDDF